ncbi:MAG: hypothetical protein K6T83_14295 [Alicyclobacillus sp.]|nr:hypothetical protein [Alicyclobacillus sp.]
MLWIAILWMGALGIGQYRALAGASPREALTWALLTGVTVTLSAWVNWQGRPAFHPLAWLEFLFGPPSRFLYHIMG